MSRRLPIPQARHLVGRAAYELRLSGAYILSSQYLSEVAESLAAEEPALRELETEGTAYELATADGSWNIRLEPEVFSLHTSGSSLEELARSLRHLLDQVLADYAELSFERVALEYFSAAPIEDQPIEELFTESVVSLISTNYDEAFTQALSGTWHRGHYTLHYGLTPVEEKTFYLCDAWVSALNVQALELDKVLWDLDEEGLRLLSWPITPQALDTFEVMSIGAEHMVPKSVFQEVWFIPCGSNLVDQMNQERARLLLKKYGRKGFSAEDEVRLEVLTDRVRLLLPQATQGDWQFLEDVNRRLDAIQERTERIRQRYGLGG